jgi:hypothetical protein
MLILFLSRNRKKLSKLKITGKNNDMGPDVDGDKKHRYPEPEFKPQPHQKSTQDYPEPQIKPQLQQKSTQNYPEPQI